MEKHDETHSFAIVFHRDDFAEEVRIPDPFVKQNSHILLVEKLVLFPSKGNPIVVCVEKRNIAVECFLTRGWADFVEETGVREGNVVIFNYDGDRSLNVMVYHTSSCSKRVMKETVQVPDVPRIGVDKTVERADFEELYFYTITFKKTYREYMYVTKEFADTLELEVGEVQLNDPNGRVWLVTFAEQAHNGRLFRRLTAGWPKFVRENGIEVGDKLTFLSKPSLGFIEVEIEKSQSLCVVKYESK